MGEGEQTDTSFADQVSTASLALTYDLLKLNTKTTPSADQPMIHRRFFITYSLET